MDTLFGNIGKLPVVFETQNGPRLKVQLGTHPNGRDGETCWVTLLADVWSPLSQAKVGMRCKVDGEKLPVKQAADGTDLYAFNVHTVSTLWFPPKREEKQVERAEGTEPSKAFTNKVEVPAGQMELGEQA